MIYQAWQTFQEYNQTGLPALFTYPANVWSGFIPLVLLAVFTITLMATFFSKKRLTGRGDFLASMAVASYLTTVVAFVMSLTDGLISLSTIVITVVITIVCTILLILSRDR